MNGGNLKRKPERLQETITQESSRVLRASVCLCAIYLKCGNVERCCQFPFRTEHQAADLILLPIYIFFEPTLSGFPRAFNFLDTTQCELNVFGMKHHLSQAT